MNQKDFTQLDALIVNTIKDGRSTFTAILNQSVCAEAKKLLPPARTPAHPPELFRVVDRRLQALRKAGRIAYDHKDGWYVRGGAT